jgi:hypothetical protein
MTTALPLIDKEATGREKNSTQATVPPTLPIQLGNKG